MAMTSYDPKWRGSIQWILGLGLTAIFLYMMAPFILAILLGAVCSILCYPIFTTLERKLPKSLSALLVTLGMSIGILAPIVSLLYLGVYRILAVISKLKIIKEGQTLESLLEYPITKKFMSTISYWVPLDREWIQSQSLDILQTVLEKSSAFVGGIISGMPSFFVSIAVVILCTYFFLADGAKFLKFLTSLSPMKTERSLALYQTFEKSCRGVVLGLFFSAVAQSILMYLFFLMTGLPNALVIGLITIIAGMVPLVGSAPIWIIATLYHVMHHDWKFAIIMLLGGTLISTIDNVIRSWIMKDQVEMHPLLALISVFGAINLFGAMGIFLGPVIAAVFVSFLKILSLEIRKENIQSKEITSYSPSSQP